MTSLRIQVIRCTPRLWNTKRLYIEGLVYTHRKKHFFAIIISTMTERNFLTSWQYKHTNKQTNTQTKRPIKYKNKHKKNKLTCDGEITKLCNNNNNTH